MWCCRIRLFLWLVNAFFYCESGETHDVTLTYRILGAVVSTENFFSSPSIWRTFSSSSTSKQAKLPREDDEKKIHSEWSLPRKRASEKKTLTNLRQHFHEPGYGSDANVCRGEEGICLRKREAEGFGAKTYTTIRSSKIKGYERKFVLHWHARNIFFSFLLFGSCENLGIDKFPFNTIRFMTRLIKKKKIVSWAEESRKRCGPVDIVLCFFLWRVPHCS